MFRAGILADQDLASIVAVEALAAWDLGAALQYCH